MKIYTKKGDSGETSLFGGERVLKCHMRIDSYGMVDELNSYLGLLRDYLDVVEVQGQLIGVQHDLFVIGSHLATSDAKKVSFLPDLQEDMVLRLERYIDAMDLELPALSAFILPGGHVCVSHAHVARCICRRAEREVVGLASDEFVDGLVIRYLNRLSDYLFTLARFLGQHYKAVEVKWEPRKK